VNIARPEMTCAERSTFVLPVATSRRSSSNSQVPSYDSYLQTFGTHARNRQISSCTVATLAAHSMCCELPAAGHGDVAIDAFAMRHAHGVFHISVVPSEQRINEWRQHRTRKRKHQTKDQEKHDQGRKPQLARFP